MIYSIISILFVSLMLFSVVSSFKYTTTHNRLPSKRNIDTKLSLSTPDLSSLSSSSVNFTPSSLSSSNGIVRLDKTMAKDIQVPYMIPGKLYIKEDYYQINTSIGAIWRERNSISTQ